MVLFFEVWLGTSLCRFLQYTPTCSSYCFCLNCFEFETLVARSAQGVRASKLEVGLLLLEVVCDRLHHHVMQRIGRNRNPRHFLP
jgi:hypothetical protein